MKINIGKRNYLVAMRSCGYKPWRNPKTGQQSFIRRTGAGFYPRFHCLMFRDREDNIIADVHFDKIRPMHKLGVRSYEDFESPVVQDEAARIAKITGGRVL